MLEKCVTLQPSEPSLDSNSNGRTSTRLGQKTFHWCSLQRRRLMSQIYLTLFYTCGLGIVVLHVMVLNHTDFPFAF
jgi:hypothetical protein